METLDIVYGYEGDDFIKNCMTCKIVYGNWVLRYNLEMNKNYGSSISYRLLLYKAMKLFKELCK